MSPGRTLPQNRVQVGAVVVQQATRIVTIVCDFDDVALENAQRRRVGQHDAGCLRPDARLERLEIDVAVRAGRNLPDHAATHGRGRRVGAVRRVGHDNFVALVVAARLVIGLNHGDAGQLALRARHRRQRHALHAGHVLEHFLQLEHAGQKALAVTDRTQRVPTRKTGQQSQRITGARVVLHRARAERIELRVDREVLLRQAREVPHDLQLGGFRQRGLSSRSNDSGMLDVSDHRCLRKCAAAAT